MTYPPKSNWGLFSNPQQARLQAQVEAQTAALLNQRNRLGFQTFNNQNWNSTNKSQAQQNSRIASKIQQIINLCESDNNLSSNEMAKVINAQKQILNMLVNKNQKNAPQNLQATFQNPQSQNYLYSVPEIQAQDPQNSQFKSNIRQKIQQNPKITVSDDLIGMIQQIQSKALTQIQRLRQQKISLMKQLKVQIQQSNNLQRQLINCKSRKIQSKIQTPFKQYRQSGAHQNYDRQGEFNQNVQQFKNYISYLQSELQKKDIIIRQLNTGSNSNNSHLITQLLEQGENIRQNTIHLIRLKQGQSQNQNQRGFNQSGQNNQLVHRIRQLQELLQKQEEQKSTFLKDLLAFKQKYQNLEQQNKELKRQSKTVGTLGTSYNQSKLYNNSFKGGNNEFDQYQKAISRMRNARH